MGNESYFITFLDHQIISKNDENNERCYFGKSLLQKNDFKKKIKKLTWKFRLKDLGKYEWFAVDNQLKMRIFYEDNYFQGFYLEGCFSNFNESLNLCFDIAQKINNEIIKLKLFHPSGIETQLDDKNNKELKKTILEKYNEKYLYFQENFHNVKFKSLPGEYFYNKYKVQRQWLKIFNFFSYYSAKIMKKS